MDRARLTKLTRKLTGTPWLPLLFISKAIEETTINYLPQPFGGGGIMGILAVLTTILWLYTADDVAWGLQQATDAVEDATDNQNT